MIKAGHADMIGLARQLIADPSTVNKLKSGRGDLIRICMACNDGCVHQAGQEKAVRCIHNPSAGRELTLNERTLKPAAEKRKIAVVGGGPAGLKVAEIAARRGHSVVLLERDRVLGGQVRLAVNQPEHSNLGEVTSYLELAIAELDVEVRKGVTATPELLAGLDCQTIILATGSEPNLPDRIRAAVSRSRALGRQVLPEIPGLDLAHVVSADRVLAGEVKPSGRVLLIDDTGHWEAAGTAEFLADMGCSVTVVAGHGAVGSELEAGTRTLFNRRAAIKSIQMMPSTIVMSIEAGRVQVADVFSSGYADGWAKYILIPGNERWIEGIDWVVPVIGRRSREDLFLELKASDLFGGKRIERVGDCVAPRLIQSNILEAYNLAETL